MIVLQRHFYNVTRLDEFTLFPIGDVHIGARACREDLLQQQVDKVKETPNAMWVGMGDYLDAVNRSDPRFNLRTLAEWVTVPDLVDLADAQRRRFIDIVRPIAGQCVGLATGNHEATITKYYERDVYREIVTEVKQAAGLEPDYQLGLGYSGWLILNFYQSAEGERRQGRIQVKVLVHHGFGGGRLAGAKALNMERYLWTHDCDILLMGHVHMLGVIPAEVQAMDRAGNPVQRRRFGVYTGCFLETSVEGANTYSEVKGYLPMPLGAAEVTLRPRAHNPNERITIVSKFR